jgi:hypothetical protein
MAPSRSGEMSASMAVLCLLVESTDTTSSLGIRLARQSLMRGGRAASRTTTWTVDSLAKQGLIRLVKKGPAGTSSLDSYEATSEGVAQVRTWIRESAVVPPVLRDSLQGKLAFSREEQDLLGLLKTVREEEDAYARRYADAHREDVKARHARRRLRARGIRAGLVDLVHDVRVSDEAAWWGLMMKRLERLREKLEVVLDEIQEPASAEGSDDG